MNFPDDSVDRMKPWSRHPHLANQVRRYSDILETWQIVMFGTPEQRDRFLTRQREALAPSRPHKTRQGPYGSHPRHRFNGNKGKVRHGS